MEKKAKLKIELIPSTSWFENVRSNISKLEWDRVRKKVYAEAHYKCEICGGKGEQHPVECHEVFEYDKEHGLQRLVRLISLCPKCHRCCHWGLWQLKGKEPELYKHIMEINGWTRSEAQKHVAESFKVWQDRSNIDWDLDLSILRDKYEIDFD
jgi:hypothetical protein